MFFQEWDVVTQKKNVNRLSLIIIFRNKRKRLLIHTGKKFRRRSCNPPRRIISVKGRKTLLNSWTIKSSREIEFSVDRVARVQIGYRLTEWNGICKAPNAPRVHTDIHRVVHVKRIKPIRTKQRVSSSIALRVRLMLRDARRIGKNERRRERKCGTPNRLRS